MCSSGMASRSISSPFLRAQKDDNERTRRGQVRRAGILSLSLYRALAKCLLSPGHQLKLALLPGREDDLEDPPHRPEDPPGVHDVGDVQHLRVVLLVDSLDLLEDGEGLQVAQHANVQTAQVQHVCHLVHGVAHVSARPREENPALVLLRQDVHAHQVLRLAVPQDLPVVPPGLLQVDRVAPQVAAVVRGRHAPPQGVLLLRGQ
mmetsp:Transcript_6707/g.20196  ORF Transcript_6707/g.20196 Transcript_6707/m.20196 type:complete len:204 (-) Transcript_6707:705-1316(-)